MTKRIINIGTSVGDGTGTGLRTAGSYINDNFTEVYNQINRLLDLNAITISDTDDLYAHESQILCHRLTDKTVLIFLYTSNKVTSAERALSAHCYLKVFELTTMTLLKKIDLYYSGLVADLTQPANEPMTAPRMYITGTTLRTFIGVKSALYGRDIDISNKDPETWTAGNLVIEQMTMKDSGGNDVTVDVNCANIQTHLEYVLGDTYAGYQLLAPWFRNLDRIAVHGTDWYSILELSDELGAGMSNIAMLVKSTDSGASWSFVSPICYTPASRSRVLEASCVFIGDVLHVINRTAGNYIWHYSSSDYGLTWANCGNLPIGTLVSKPTAINYYKSDGSTLDVICAFNLTSEITDAPHRTTLGIYTTSDFLSFVEIGKIVSTSFAHYPSLCFFDRGIYLSYTKGLKFNTIGYNAYSYDRDTIVLTKVW